MVRPTISDEEFIELWKKTKSARALSRIVGVTLRNVMIRRRKLEEKYKIELRAEHKNGPKMHHLSTSHLHKARLTLGLQDGVVIVFSDAHFWPAIRTTAMRGLLWAIGELQPKAVICNGDAFDGASISRFPRIGWDSKPSIIQELNACKASLGEIDDAAKAARKECKLIWTLGNHDARFENRLAQAAPEFENVSGFTLKDHFPDWIPAWSCWPTETVCVKHRFKGGIHATHNNTINSGTSIITGHLHSLKVTPFSDYTGTRYGVDTGTLADTNGPQFTDYLEDNPVNWRSGFAILTFHKGRLLWPELAHCFADNVLEFRGKLVNVTDF